MMYIITGEIDCGKTTKLQLLYNDIGRGDGFILKKIYVDGINIGQKILQLSTGESRTFSIRDGAYDEGWDEIYRYGPYSFSKTGFLFAQAIAQNILDNGIEPIFMDEIGPLELQKKGFYNIFNNFLATGLDIYVVVRFSCVKDVIKLFNITKYRTINV